MSIRRKLLSLILGLSLGLSTLTVGRDYRFIGQAKDASVGIFLTQNGKRALICSGTSIPSPSKDYGLVLTARHCVSDLDTNQIYAETFGSPEEVSFSDNELGPYYTTEIEGISNDEDFAILRVINGGHLPVVQIGDEHKTKGLIFNWSFPLDSGKLFTHGELLSTQFPHFPRDLVGFPFWRNSMPADILISHGSSGSGVFDPYQRKLVGIIVGILLPDQMKILIPASRVLDFLQHPVPLEAWKKAHPVTPSFNFLDDDD